MINSTILIIEKTRGELIEVSITKINEETKIKNIIKRSNFNPFFVIESPKKSFKFF